MRASLIPGHGMARIPFTSRGLAKTIASGSWSDTLPSSFRITSERLEKAQTSPPFITEMERTGSWWPFAKDQQKSLVR